MDNPVVLIILIALACAAVIAGAVIVANIYRRREAAADEQREADRAASYVPKRTQPTPAGQSAHTQAAPARYDSRPVQQTVVHDNSGADLVNLLVMQQVLNSIGNDHHHEDRSGTGTEAQEQESAPETSYEAPVYSAPEPVSYSAPSYDSSPSYSDSSSSYSDSGSSGGGGDF